MKRLLTAVAIIGIIIAGYITGNYIAVKKILGRQNKTIISKIYNTPFDSKSRGKIIGKIAEIYKKEVKDRADLERKIEQTENGYLREIEKRIFIERYPAIIKKGDSPTPEDYGVSYEKFSEYKELVSTVLEKYHSLNLAGDVIPPRYVHADASELERIVYASKDLEFQEEILPDARPAELEEVKKFLALFDLPLTGIYYSVNRDSCVYMTGLSVILAQNLGIDLRPATGNGGKHTVGIVRINNPYNKRIEEYRIDFSASQYADVMLGLTITPRTVVLPELPVDAVAEKKIHEAYSSEGQRDYAFCERDPGLVYPEHIIKALTEAAR